MQCRRQSQFNVKTITFRDTCHNHPHYLQGVVRAKAPSLFVGLVFYWIAVRLARQVVTSDILSNGKIAFGTWSTLIRPWERIVFHFRSSTAFWWCSGSNMIYAPTKTVPYCVCQGKIFDTALEGCHDWIFLGWINWIQFYQQRVLGQISWGTWTHELFYFLDGE